MTGEFTNAAIEYTETPVSPKTNVDIFRYLKKTFLRVMIPEKVNKKVFIVYKKDFKSSSHLVENKLESPKFGINSLKT